ncbi:hypothetical protein ACFO4E_10070 [Nocardiopsis mangrovi]|uniref:Uncharacterized protein n=1 Tax=Nocardiopsis mangrovi TaxID=1179818 RepID=A0ABV9DW74_9ACTN
MATPATTGHGAHMFLRVAVALQTLMVFVQAVSAGLLLSAPYGEALHGIGARVVFAAAMLHVAAAVAVRRRGGGSPRAVLYAAGFLGLLPAQVVLGIAHVTALHVPLGVLLFGMSVLQFACVLAARRARAATAA